MAILFNLAARCCGLVLVAIFSIPCIGGNHGVPDGIFQAACILLLFPLIILTGAGSVTTDPRSTAVCKWLTENWLKRKR